MTKADELWEKYQYEGWIGPTAFKAALSEYGQAVRARDVEICRQYFDKADGYDAAIDTQAAASGCAAAIAREPLPVDNPRKTR